MVTAVENNTGLKVPIKSILLQVAARNERVFNG